MLDLLASSVLVKGFYWLIPSGNCWKINLTRRCAKNCKSSLDAGSTSKSILIDPHVNMSNLTGSKSMFASKWFWSLWIFPPFIRTLWKVWLFNSICVLLVLQAFIQTWVEKANLHWVASSLLNTVYGWYCACFIEIHASYSQVALVKSQICS